MNYAFKMMAVVLALGVLVLQGCQTTSNQVSDAFICSMAVNQDNEWSNYKGVQKYVSLAKKKKLHCGIKDKIQNVSNSKSLKSKYDICLTDKSKAKLQNLDCPNIIFHENKYNITLSYSTLPDLILCNRLIYNKSNDEGPWKNTLQLYIEEANRRNINCNTFPNISKLGVLNPKKPLDRLYIAQTSSNYTVCKNATYTDGSWRRGFGKEFVNEAKSRGLDCGVGSNNKNVVASNIKINLNETLKSFSNYRLCPTATIKIPMKEEYRWDYRSNYSTKAVYEAKRRGLNCGVGGNKTVVASNIKINLNETLKSFSNYRLCPTATIKIPMKEEYRWDYRSNYSTKAVYEAKRRGLNCGVRDNKTIIASKLKTKTYIKPKSTITSAELNASKREAVDLRKKLAALENKQKQEQQRIDTDNQLPIISAFTKLNGSNAIISGRVTDNTEVAEVLIDGQSQQLSSNGTFETNFYIPRTGKTIEIVAFDIKGNKASKLLKIERGNIQQASGPTFDTLNPSVKRVKSNPNALALIIGISDYSKTNANAIYADKDAQQFYDYATMKLGVPARNVKELVNDKADLGEIGLAVQDWIARSAKKNKTDIYIFFAGHGLASDDGKDMYLLPYDGRPRLLDKTALLRDELFKEIQQSNPRSVTVFLDTCYSGTTRGTDMLIASRPIMIKAKEQSIPNNFTVFSAAAGDQTSKPLEEAKHGMFSYFLMKGMEGDADTNSDNKITAQELHNYVKENVTQQSSGSQTPELQGDKDRVLVQFN